MSRGTHPVGVYSSTTWAFFVVFALALLSGSVSYAGDCNYDGGWSLRQEGICPSIAQRNCSTTLDGSQLRCCPYGYECSGIEGFEGQFCCKGIDQNSQESCLQHATGHPKCSDPTMSLWGTNPPNVNRGLWCCGSGDMGVYNDTGNEKDLVFLCTATTETALATGLRSGVPMSQCSEASAPAGAIAGGVVGGVAGIALVAAGIYFFLKKRKRRDSTQEPSTDARVQEEDQWSQQLRAESHKRRRSELETVEPRLEMNAVRPRYELDATEEEQREREVSPLGSPLR